MNEMTKECKKCHSQLKAHENMDTGLCRNCWLTTEQEHIPGVEMTGADWENFCESE